MTLMFVFSTLIMNSKKKLGNNLGYSIGWSLAGDVIFTQTKPQIIWQSCKHILDLVHPPNRTKIIQDKNRSIDVYTCF